jgi:hypothetical protein
VQLSWLHGDMDIVLPQLISRAITVIMDGSVVSFVALHLCCFLAYNAQARRQMRTSVAPLHCALCC